MFYKGEDYIVWAIKSEDFKSGNENMHYFLKYHTCTNLEAEVIEISQELFMMYIEEFKKPLENHRNECRRHFDDISLEDYLVSLDFASDTNESEDKHLTKLAIATILEKCTETQKRRFNLYHVQGFTFSEIATMESCTKQRVKKSVDSVIEKIKKYFN